jgi:glycosyltransferase involved in cell wall biosynthesis
MYSAKNKKICFISHNATRTGAPIVLLQFVKWLKAYHNHAIEVWFIKGGEMIEDFEKICACKILQEAPAKGLRALTRSVTRRIFKKDLALHRKLKGLARFDLLFFNTAASFKIIPLLPKGLRSRSVAWLHEQPFSIKSWYQEQFNRQNLLFFDHIISVSSQTKNYLEASMGMASTKLSVVHPFIDIAALLNNREKIITDTEKTQPFLVGGCGLQDWRKGPDLFLQVAWKTALKYPALDIRFVWIGAESSMTLALQYETEHLKLQDKMVFTGEQKNSKEWFSRFDLFLLTSREDPFPLVVLEAAVLQKPVICFEGIGDITALVGLIPENVVGYSDVDAMVERLISYYENRELVNRHGTILQKKVVDYDTSLGAEQIYGLL